MRPLEFGWYLPTHGDTTAYGVPEAQVRFGRLSARFSRTTIAAGLRPDGHATAQTLSRSIPNRRFTSAAGLAALNR
jgi:hypothetical protein